jgi:hypothetical protein
MSAFIISCGEDSMQSDYDLTHTLPEPVSNWLVVEKVDDEHILRASDLYYWNYTNGIKNVYFGADGDFISLEEDKPLKTSGKLGYVNIEKLHTYQIENYNKSLSKKLGFEVNYMSVYTVRVFSSRGGAFDMAFYLNYDVLEYIKVCIDHCLSLEPKVLKAELRKEKAVVAN